MSLLLLFSAPEKRREWGVGVSPTKRRDYEVTLLSGRSDVIFDPKVSHFATVPTILYTPKVSSEHLVDDCGTGLNHHRNDPKVTILAKNADFSSKSGSFLLHFGQKYHLLPHFSLLPQHIKRPVQRLSERCVAVWQQIHEKFFLSDKQAGHAK